MALFEKQGLHAASAEPFAEFCDTHNIDISLHAGKRSLQIDKLAAWNQTLLMSHIVNTKAATESFEKFLSLDNSSDI